MSDSLRDRIAAAIQNACESGVMVGYGTMADAVIAEVGLRREGGYPSALRIAMQRRRPDVSDYRYRYVTDWKADDE